MSNVYIHPAQNAGFKVFLKNTKGKYVKWPDSVTSSYGKGRRCAIEKQNNNLALYVTGRHAATCRETLCNVVWDFLSAIKIPPKYTMTLDPPTTSTGRPIVKDLSSFSIYVGGSEDGRKVSTSIDGGPAVFKKGYLLSTTKSAQEKVYELMDVLMGTTGMLLGGPSAYTRTLVSKNKVKLSKARNTTYVRYVPGGNMFYSARTETLKTKSAKARMEYTGLSNFWVRHPASFSILTGLSRMALELWFDGKYEEIDNEMDIPSLRRWLAEMAKKEKFTKKDKNELLEVLEWFKPYFESSKVNGNLGAYPINKYTFDMLIKFADRKKSTKKTIAEIWRGQTGGSAYGLGNYGFYTWCSKHKNQTPKFSRNSDDYSWGGLNGQRLAFGGH